MNTSTVAQSQKKTKDADHVSVSVPVPVPTITIVTTAQFDLWGSPIAVSEMPSDRSSDRVTSPHQMRRCHRSTPR
ncbi:hypothetical protein N7478_000293 [Penicillium angulare]|uniref:uncharacterized protein n=1 Tax=Penicillium angulare TaxID=116970 RepID=UPI002542636B|nr:uncharacterized protein N7478_000293 [Penicillium angulare]KAJ5291042.1 hypothetical protein N7478_000293 [Penicillium angulare]